MACIRSRSANRPGPGWTNVTLSGLLDTAPRDAVRGVNLFPCIWECWPTYHVGLVVLCVLFATHRRVPRQVAGRGLCVRIQDDRTQGESTEAREATASRPGSASRRHGRTGPRRELLGVVVVAHAGEFRDTTGVGGRLFRIAISRDRSGCREPRVSCPEDGHRAVFISSSLANPKLTIFYCFILACSSPPPFHRHWTDTWKLQVIALLLYQASLLGTSKVS